MKNVFVESTIFEKHRDNYLSDDEFRMLQTQLMAILLLVMLFKEQVVYVKLELVAKVKESEVGHE